MQKFLEKRQKIIDEKDEKTRADLRPVFPSCNTDHRQCGIDRVSSALPGIFRWNRIILHKDLHHLRVDADLGETPCRRRRCWTRYGDLGRDVLAQTPARDVSTPSTFPPRFTPGLTRNPSLRAHRHIHLDRWVRLRSSTSSIRSRDIRQRDRSISCFAKTGSVLRLSAKFSSSARAPPASGCRGPARTASSRRRRGSHARRPG